MLLSIIICLFSVLFLTKAEKVTFKVLAVNGNPILNIDGQHYEMAAVQNSYPLYETTVDVNGFPVNYNYLLDYGDGNTEQEEFSRQRLKDEASLNEYFGRSITIKEHPLLPRAYEAFPYSTYSKLYNDNYIATIIVNCDPNQLQELYNNVSSKEKIDAEVIYASPYDIKTFKSAKIGLSGQSTRFSSKLSYKIKDLKDEDGKALFNRSSIKLRAEHMDPTFLRDKIYGDILNTLGVPTAQNSFARLFINGEAIGFFDITDNVQSDRYLRETFNSGKKFDKSLINPLFKGIRNTDAGIFSDLSYQGEDATQQAYAVYQYKSSDKEDDNTANDQQHIANDLIPLLKEIDDYKNGNINELSLDTETFLRYMALEFLGGAVDNYWNLPGNYYLFKNLVNNVWYFHDVDFHYTFGVNWAGSLMLETSLADFPPYMEEEKIGKERPLLDALRSRPENEERLKKIFERLLLTSFHPNALFPRIESLVTLVREDAHWDISLEKVKPDAVNANEYIFTFENFEIDATSELNNSPNGGIPIRYFIKNKSSLLSKELGIQIPLDYLSDLGFVDYVELSDIGKAAVDSGSMKTISWSIFSVFLGFIILKIFY